MTGTPVTNRGGAPQSFIVQPRVILRLDLHQTSVATFGANLVCDERGRGKNVHHVNEIVYAGNQFCEKPEKDVRPVRVRGLGQL
jgi:hypothetical protein